MLELMDQHGRFKYSSSEDDVNFFGKLVGFSDQASDASTFTLFLTSGDIW